MLQGMVCSWYFISFSSKTSSGQYIRTLTELLLTRSSFPTRFQAAGYGNGVQNGYQAVAQGTGYPANAVQGGGAAGWGY